MSNYTRAASVVYLIHQGLRDENRNIAWAERWLESMGGSGGGTINPQIMADLAELAIVALEMLADTTGTAFDDVLTSLDRQPANPISGRGPERSAALT